MINKKDITKMVRHIFKRNKSISDPKIMHPIREWNIGLSVSFVGIVVGAWISATLFISHSNNPESQSDVVVKSVPYKSALVESALELYNEKMKIYESISGASVIVTSDPESLLPQTSSSTDANATTTSNVEDTKSQKSINPDNVQLAP